MLEPKTQPSDRTSSLREYTSFVEQTASWLGKRANLYHWSYNGAKIITVLLGILIPLLSQGLLGDAGKSAVPWAGAVIAALAAFEGFFKPGDTWRHFRSYQLALRRSLRMLQPALAEVQGSDPAIREEKLAELHRQFVTQTEHLLDEEARKFFERVKEPATNSQTFHGVAPNPAAPPEG